MDSNWGIVDHEWAVRLLSDRIASGRASHATLIAGPGSIGKRALALRLAQAMMCAQPDAPCGVCRACDLVARLQHPDLHVLEPDQTGKIKIEPIRELLNELALRPFEALCCVTLIFDFHSATEPAMDALLKTLEEPPSTSRIILTADVAETLLPTIVSRCQVIALRPVPAPHIEAALRERYDVSPAEAARVARLAAGRPGWAFAALEQPDRLVEHAQMIDQLLAALGSNRSGRFAHAEALSRFDRLGLVLEVWQSWWRDVLLVAEGSGVAPIHADRLADLTRLAEKVGPAAARRALIAVRETIQYLGRYVNTRLALEVMFLEMPYLGS